MDIPRRSLLFFSICFSVCWLLVACTGSDRFVSGHPITPEELASISEAVFATVPPDPADTEPWIETLPDAEVYPAGTVHWTAGGSVYHDDPACYHLQKASVIYHGTPENASLAGKEKLCSSCEKRSHETKN